MKLARIIGVLETAAPRGLQESWDNSGLQIGLPEGGNAEITGILLCIDVTEEIIYEAIARGCNLVISHHPLIFKGFKQLTGANPPQRAAIAAIKKGVAVYSAHTSLDSAHNGVSWEMARRLGLKVISPLVPTEQSMVKITVTAPRRYYEDVAMLLSMEENSNLVSFQVESSDLKEEKTNINDVPSFFIAHEPLTRVEITTVKHEATRKLSLLENSDFFSKITVNTQALADLSTENGLGVVAIAEQPFSASTLRKAMKDAFKLDGFRSNLAANQDDITIRKIALCGGAGGEFIRNAIATGAQAYITADIRYHDFCDHRNDILLFDIGHFESENCAKDIIYRLITENFPNFAVYYSETETNPVKYYN